MATDPLSPEGPERNVVESLAQIDSLKPRAPGIRRVNAGPPLAADLYPPAPPPIVMPTIEELQLLSINDQRKALEARVEWLRRSAPHSLLAHAQLIHRDDAGTPIVAASHHAEWVRILEDRDTYPWVCVVAPPGYAKSTWFSVIYPTWRLGATKGRIRIGIVSNAAGQASAFAAAVGDAVQTQAFQAAYPTVQPNKKRGWGKGSFYVHGAPEGANPSVLSSGLGGVSVLGKRFDEIILDDPTTWENARSQTVMDGQRHFLKTTLVSRFPPGMGPPDGTGGRMTVVCTRWSENDLVPTLRELGFKIVRMPSLGYWDGDGDPASDDFEPGDAPLWPERESAEQLHALREDDELVFELVMQGNPKVLSGDVFDPAWIRRANPPKRRHFDKVTQFVDTAGGRDRDKGDYFAMATVGLIRKPEPQYWILNMHRERLSSLRQLDKVIQQAKEWEPDSVTVEDVNEGRALYDRLVAETNLPVKKFVPVRDKEFRAMPMAAKYRAGLVWHPEGEKWTRSYEAELEAFPNGSHDDQVDAAAGAMASLLRSGPRLRVLS